MFTNPERRDYEPRASNSFLPVFLIHRVIRQIQQSGDVFVVRIPFDPATQQWSVGPELNESGRLAGFGSSAFAVGGRLYVTAYDGSLQRLAEDGSSWERLLGLEKSRFFHRMLPHGDDSLLVIAGANMRSGSYNDVIVLSTQSALQ